MSQVREPEVQPLDPQVDVPWEWFLTHSWLCVWYIANDNPPLLENRTCKYHSPSLECNCLKANDHELFMIKSQAETSTAVNRDTTALK